MSFDGKNNDLTAKVSLLTLTKTVPGIYLQYTHIGIHTVDMSAAPSKKKKKLVRTYLAFFKCQTSINVYINMSVRFEPSRQTFHHAIVPTTISERRALVSPRREGKHIALLLHLPLSESEGH